ncbi:MAG TPA: serine/threonine-protein kinase, partial [Candidatus Limnocylindrales bacterium]|nr:serine/threonine-protein kinase [Candidatus Limnocylindrales bacterium]
MALTEGQMLGQYRIEAPMGQGGMATIYRATQSRLGRVVAIKMMHPAFVQDAAFLTRFEREAQIVAQLDHPHIVPVYDFSDYNGQPYLIMKYIDGTTLKQALEAGPMTAADVLRIMTPIAAALDYAHRQGVLHRDIKPSNILLSADGTPYLTDFGLARMAALGSSTLSGDMLLGTPHYISPEQALGTENLTPATDLYSLGVVLYEMATGRVPYTGDTPYAIVHAHIYDPLPAPRVVNPALSAEVEAVLVKALAKDPDGRYATAADLIDAYRAAVESETAAPAGQDKSPERATPAQREPSSAVVLPLP